MHSTGWPTTSCGSKAVGRLSSSSGCAEQYQLSPTLFRNHDVASDSDHPATPVVDLQDQYGCELLVESCFRLATPRPDMLHSLCRSNLIPRNSSSTNPPPALAASARCVPFHPLPSNGTCGGSKTRRGRPQEEAPCLPIDGVQCALDAPGASTKVRSPTRWR